MATSSLAEESSPTNKRGVRALPLLTESRMKTYRRCPREERLRYQTGLRSAETDAMRFGTLVHSALEAWWTGEGVERLANALKILGEAECDPYERAKAEVLLTGYHIRWEEAGFRTVAVEQEFRIPLVNPDTSAESKTWQLGGKIDAIVETQDGRIWIVEHKTSGVDIGPGSGYMSRLRLDGQISMYLHAARALGYEPAGVIYDVIGKPQLRPLEVNTRRSEPETPEAYGKRCAESVGKDPDRYYQRANVVRLESEVAEFDRELWQLATTMRDAVRTGVAPRNPDGCQRYGSTCSYFALCCGEESIDDQKWERLEWAHPELTRP